MCEGVQSGIIHISIFRWNIPSASNVYTGMTHQALSDLSNLPFEQAIEVARQTSDGIDLGKRRLAYLFDDMHERRTFDRTGYADVASFAEMELGKSRKRSSELLRIGRQLRNLPIVDNAFLDGKIMWTAMTRILSVVQFETQTAWVEFAIGKTLAEVNRIVKRCKPGQRPDQADVYDSKAFARRIIHDIDAETEAMLDLAQAALAAEEGRPLTEAELYRAALDKLAEHFGDEAPEPETPERLPYEDRNHDPIEPELREQILNRDHHECRSCGSRYKLRVHHIHPRHSGGPNTPANLITTCNRCHTKIHQGFLKLTGNPERKITWTDATGTPLGRTTWRPPTPPAERSAPPTITPSD